MTRLLDTLHAVLAGGRLASVLDALLLALGVTATVTAALPLLARVGARRRASPRARRGAWIALLPALALAAPAPACADGPAAQLGQQIGRVLRILEDPALRAPGAAAARRAELRRVAAEVFDVTEITRRALAQHWAGRTAAEREELAGLMAALLERAYLTRLERYEGERVSIVGELLDGDLATVRTRIVTRQGTEIPVDYRLHRVGARWLAYDVVVEGVSLVANYRAQFARILQGHSHQELVRRLRARLAEPEEAGDFPRASRR